MTWPAELRGRPGRWRACYCGEGLAPQHAAAAALKQRAQRSRTNLLVGYRCDVSAHAVSGLCYHQVGHALLRDQRLRRR